MAAPLLFPSMNETAAGPQKTSLVEFRAGRCFLDKTTVTSDTRKGLVQLNVQEDGIVHLTWKDRTTGLVEEDAMLFPGSAEFVKVAQCTTGRVFVVKFIGSSRRIFFWMQEPKDDQDEAICTKVNDLIDNPPPFGAGMGGGMGGGGGGMGGLGAFGGAGLGGLEQNQLLELLAQQQAQVSGIPSPGMDTSTDDAGNGTSSSSSPPADAPSATPAPAGTGATADNTTTPATTGTPAQPPPLLPANLTSLLAGGAGAATPSGPSLGNIITPEEVIPLLQDESIREALQPLLPDTGSPEEIADAVRSPQFRQMLDSLSHALQAGDPASQSFLMQSFGLNPEGPGIEAFLRAIQEAQDKKKSEGGDSDKMDTE